MTRNFHICLTFVSIVSLTINSVNRFNTVIISITLHQKILSQLRELLKFSSKSEISSKTIVNSFPKNFLASKFTDLFHYHFMSDCKLDCYGSDI